MATRALRGSPHVLNALLLTAALAPITVFAMTRGPAPEALEETLVRGWWLVAGCLGDPSLLHLPPTAARGVPGAGGPRGAHERVLVQDALDA